MKSVALTGSAMAGLFAVLSVNWYMTLSRLGLWWLGLLFAGIGVAMTLVALFVAIVSWRER